jgi:tRNA-dihydrouridine synthase
MRESVIQNKDLNRKISVAPMMDWTDESYFISWISYLESRKKACLLYVTSI